MAWLTFEKSLETFMTWRVVRVLNTLCAFWKLSSQISNKGHTKCHFRVWCCPLLWVTFYIIRCVIKLERISCGVTGFSIDSWQFPFKSCVWLLICSQTQISMLACVDVINIWVPGWHKIQPGIHTKYLRLLFVYMSVKLECKLWLGQLRDCSLHKGTKKKSHPIMDIF